MKKLSRLIGLVVLAGLFLLGLAQGSPAQVVQMKFGHFAADSHQGNLA
jgi:hypothetical protein